jgi:hypothetical protein
MGLLGHVNGGGDHPQGTVPLHHHGQSVGEDLVVVADEQGGRPVCITLQSVTLLEASP